MADGQPTTQDKKDFFDWYAQQYGGKPGWPLSANWKSSPEYTYWRQNIKKALGGAMAPPTGQDFTPEAYLYALKSSLDFMLKGGQIDQTVYDDIMTSAQTSIQSGVWQSAPYILPYYSDIAGRYRGWAKTLPGEEGMTAYQQSQETRANRKAYLDELQMWLNRQQAGGEEVGGRDELGWAQLEQQKQQGLMSQMESQRRYEAELRASPRNWIQLWNYQNPRAPQPTGSVPWSSILAERQARVGPALERWQANPDVINTSLYQQAAGDYASSLQANQQALAASAARTEFGTQQEAPVPGLQVPSWMSAFNPNIRQTRRWGEPITRERIPIASGQLWSQTTPSQAEMLKGYIDYAGNVPGQVTAEDYEYLVQSMLPKAMPQARARAARQV